MPDKEIDVNEYREIKEEHEAEIGKLERGIDKIAHWTATSKVK